MCVEFFCFSFSIFLLLLFVFPSASVSGCVGVGVIKTLLLRMFDSFCFFGKLVRGGKQFENIFLYITFWMVFDLIAAFIFIGLAFC